MYIMWRVHITVAPLKRSFRKARNVKYLNLCMLLGVCVSDLHLIGR
jgi:hypothetical protein